jgi:hypothetical protein
MNRWRLIAYVAAGALFYALFLAATLPAWWMEKLLDHLGQGQVALRDTSGTFWNGEGLLSVRAPGQRVPPARVQWALKPLGLFTGEIQTDISASNGDIEGHATLRLGYHRLGVTAVDITLPAALTGAVYAPASLAAPTGRLRILSSSAELSAAGLSGDIQLDWLNAGARFGGLAEIGDYRLTISGHGPSAGLHLDTLRGKTTLTAQGEWQLSGNGALSLEGALSAGEHDAVLLPLLPNPRREGDQHRFTLQTSLPVPLKTVVGLPGPPES